MYGSFVYYRILTPVESLKIVHEAESSYVKSDNTLRTIHKLLLKSPGKLMQFMFLVIWFTGLTEYVQTPTTEASEED